MAMLLPALQRLLRPVAAAAPPHTTVLLRSQFSPFLQAQRQARTAAAQPQKNQSKARRSNAKAGRSDAKAGRSDAKAGRAATAKAAEMAALVEADDLVKLWADARKFSEIKQDEVQLASLREKTAAALPRMKGTGITRVSHTAANASLGRSSLSFMEPRWLGFWREIDSAVQPVLALPEQDRRNNFKPRDLVSLAWSFAEARVAAPSLFAALATKLTPSVGELRPRDVATTAWAFAMLGEQAPLLFEALGETASERLVEFRPAEIAALMWAFAAADHARSALFSRSDFGLFLEHSVFTESDLSQLHQWALWAEDRCAPCMCMRAALHAHARRPARVLSAGA